ncbi:Ribonuclease H-like domain containing protein, partial [Parasponia andersonii]
KAVDQCLYDRGITRVFTITVDNATSNDNGVTHMAKKINNRCNAILNCDHMHIRCATHILNLVANDGLEEYSGCVTKIRDIIRYVTTSSLRMAKFKNGAEKDNIFTKRFLCLDVPIRWNSTYLMLNITEKFEKAFDQIEDDDARYSWEFCEGITKKMS